MSKPHVDYGVYLVTDSTPAILGDRDLCWVVEEAVKGGVTIAQYRDKTSDDAHVRETAKKLYQITKRFGVPLLLNDRVQLAAELGDECDGVHIGQDDIALKEARKLLGPDKIIGVTASSKAEALDAASSGADYLGIGTVYSTATKKDAKAIIGPNGVKDILAALASAGHASLSSVCIGGINLSNVQSVMTQSSSPAKSLDGVAVVSAIVSANNPASAARDFQSRVTTAKMADVIKMVAQKTPLSHNMTNLVVQNFAANVALAVGGSPIMSNNPDEAEDLAKLGGALVINMGTSTPEGLRAYQRAISAYNAAKRPVLLDPVGAGATAVRRAATAALLSSGHFAVIKGNENEIQTVAGTTVSQRGVDGSSSLNVEQRARVVRDLARKLGNVILMTGVTDVISDGQRTFRIDNGHEYLGMITGTGCTLGTTISIMIATASRASDVLVAAVAGTVMFGVAAEMAAVRSEVTGPGTFVPAFLDELYTIRKATSQGDLRWLAMVKVQALNLE